MAYKVKTIRQIRFALARRGGGLDRIHSLERQRAGILPQYAPRLSSQDKPGQYGLMTRTELLDWAHQTNLGTNLIPPWDQVQISSDAAMLDITTTCAPGSSSHWA